MKQTIIFIFLFNSVALISQETNYYWNEFEYKEYFDLVGNVKEIEVFEVVTYFSGVDSITSSYNTKIKQLYNKNAFLLKEYQIDGNDSLFLSKENTFDKYNNLLKSVEYAKKWKYVNKEYLPTNEIQSYTEKYLYDEEGRFLTKHQKTSWDKEFYLSERNIYKDGKLIKKEELNNHKETNIYSRASCKGNGYTLNDFVIYYKYNDKGLLINIKKYIDESKRYRDTIMDIKFRDTIIKNHKLSIPIIRKENNKDFSGFALEYEEKYKYDVDNKLIFEKRINHHKKYFHSEDEVNYEYWGNKKIKTIRTNKRGASSGNLKEYQIINDDTLISKLWYLNSKTVDGKLKKRLSYEYIYNPDGSFKKVHYNYDKINSVELYNTKKDLYKSKNIEDNEIRKIKYKYDSNDNWIEKITQSVGEKERIIRKITYYDL